MHKILCIVLLNYKNEQDTVKCLESILDSEISEIPFVTVVDNNASGSNLIEKLLFYPELKVLESENNLGFARGINYGIGWAKNNLDFDFLLILNNDVIVEKSAIRILLEGAHRNPEISYFTPCIITHDILPKIWYAGGKLRFSRMTPVVFNIGMEYRSTAQYDHPTHFASGCAFLVSYRSLKQNGTFFDPAFFMYDEDVELSLRLSLSGEPIFFVSNAIIIHKCQSSQSQDANKTINQLSPGNRNLIFYLENTINNRYYITDKHFKGLERLKIHASITIYWLLKSVQFFIYLNFKAGFIVLREVFSYYFKRENVITSNKL